MRGFILFIVIISHAASADQWSDSEFDENSDFHSSTGGSDAKPTPTSKGGGDRRVKNLPFDEALDVSVSSASMSDAKSPAPVRGGGGGGGGGGGRGGGAGAKGEASGREQLKNRPFDEEHSVGDDSGDLSSEDSIMTNDSEPKGVSNRGAAAQAKSAAAAPQAQATPVAQKSPPSAAQAKATPGSVDSESGSESGTDSGSDEDDDDAPNGAGGAAGAGGGGGGGGGGVLKGGYDPNDYKNLPVSSEVKDLFQYIAR